MYIAPYTSTCSSCNILRIESAINHLVDGVNLKDRNSLTGILQQVNQRNAIFFLPNIILKVGIGQNQIRSINSLASVIVHSSVVLKRAVNSR